MQIEKIGFGKPLIVISIHVCNSPLLVTKKDTTLKSNLNNQFLSVMHKALTNCRSQYMGHTI